MRQVSDLINVYSIQVFYVFPAIAEAVMKSGGLNDYDLSYIIASYAPTVHHIHLLTPILREVIRRDELCDWMEV